MLADALRAFARTGPGDAIEIDGKVYRRRIQRRVEVIEYVTVLDAHGAEVLDREAPTRAGPATQDLTILAKTWRAGYDPWSSGRVRPCPRQRPAPTGRRHLRPRRAGRSRH